MAPSHRRFYPGSDTGEHLCDWLNHSRANTRVVELLSDLRDAMQFGGSFTMWKHEPTREIKRGDQMEAIVIAAKTENPLTLGYHVIRERITEVEAEKHTSKYGPRQRKKVWAKLARMLRRYSFVPELDEWIKFPIKKTQPGRRMSFHWRSRNGQEGMAVLWILELLKIGRLNRVRRCQHCKKWFFSAVKEEGKFCSIKCQRVFSRSKEETREQHTEYMREWRDRRRR
jgi:hypothetical protein